MLVLLLLVDELVDEAVGEADDADGLDEVWGGADVGSATDGDVGTAAVPPTLAQEARTADRTAADAMASTRRRRVITWGAGPMGSGAVGRPCDMSSFCQPT